MQNCPLPWKLSGSFHQFATFISGIAALPRIVTISDLKLEPQKEGNATRRQK